MIRPIVAVSAAAAGIAAVAIVVVFRSPERDTVRVVLRTTPLPGSPFTLQGFATRSKPACATPRRAGPAG